MRKNQYGTTGSPGLAAAVNTQSRDKTQKHQRTDGKNGIDYGVANRAHKTAVIQKSLVIRQANELAGRQVFIGQTGDEILKKRVEHKQKKKKKERQDQEQAGLCITVQPAPFKAFHGMVRKKTHFSQGAAISASSSLCALASASAAGILL